ncbi:uncharacterized protein CELE_R107.5 [Caenorhabditis elegans]|uniref:Isoform a of Uncharacterized protein R107.5 n=1 Tax=Caenorhabditis elegans TaxID=6239 RepID=P32743-2|nr:Uncharacterized protein CELE_R107.5 [Caenorhabditis elegans]CAA78470.1 Uncharacterized protein CELE_R107.5 [Caenorhabditis elegans]|eukprot:NP_499004.1 Uncharacterized protein CELE_R107.5 [Caenorhabditis elegans]
MTQLTNFSESFSNQNSNLHQPYNFNSHQPPEENHYYVREPNGKRPFPVEFELDMEYVPRTKRRFDKISACLENFSISNDKPSPINMESSSDEEMDEVYDDSNFDQCTESTSIPLVVEPDDEPAVAKKIRLDESIQRYFEKCRQGPIDFLPKPEKLKGNEMVIWQPRILVSPKNDFNMAGRIQEIDDEEEDRVNEEIKTRIIENEGMIDEDTRNETTGIVELGTGSDHSDIGSSWSSPMASPTGSSQIVELDPDSPNSLTNGSVTDEEMMEFE